VVAVARLSRLDRIRLAIFGLVSLTAWLLATGTWSPEPYRRLGFALDDWRQSQMLTATPDARIALVDIDERSLDAVGPWPWPRAVMAQVAQNLFKQYHAKAVGLDIMFPEAGTPDGDRALLAVAHRYPLVFGEAFDLSTDAPAPHAGHVGGALPPPITASHAPVADGFIGNFFKSPDVCVGHVTPYTDVDGVVRSIAPLIRYANSTYPMLVWQLLDCRVAGPSRLPSIASLPVDARGLMHISFRRPMQTFDVVPAIEVLAGTAPAALLTGRYVLVGSSALGLTDHVAAPIDPWMPAVIVHAELLTELLDVEAQHGFTTPVAWLPVLWTAGAIVSFALLFRLQRASVALPTLIATTALWLVLIISIRAVPSHLAALPLVPTSVFLLVQAPFEWISSQASIRSFERRFSRYLPPTVLREIVRRRGLSAFKPERRQISVLFVDIEGYTQIAEQVSPERLVAMTEVILTRLTRCVYDTEGTLDKYMGDALMAFWGAPLEQEDHADRALDCARAMLHELDALNRSAEPLFDNRPIRVRIGVNSGNAVVGELGSTLRQSYTAIGDAINVAARLQEYAKVAGTDLLVGQETAHRSTRHRLREFTRATLRGRIAPELLYVLHKGENGAVH
jgi:adenylate cyclase